MAPQRPWFRIMTPADANQPGSQWVRKGAASYGKFVVLPITPEGWIAVLVIVALIAASQWAIWAGVAAGAISLPWALVCGVLSAVTLVAALAAVIRARSER